MELWIRSQEKTRLIKVNNILAYCFEDGSCGIQINGQCFVGDYTTKERALEVLDEIQQKLMPISEYKHEVVNLIIDYKNIDTVVYEMPQE